MVNNKVANPDTAGKKIFRIITDILFWLLILLLVGGSLLFYFNNDTSKTYFGYRIYAVITDSMSPNADGSSPPGGFHKGDLIFIADKIDEQAYGRAGNVAVEKEFIFIHFL